MMRSRSRKARYTCMRFVAVVCAEMAAMECMSVFVRVCGSVAVLGGTPWKGMRREGRRVKGLVEGAVS